ncbi:hypothetical protein [Streptomyces sp. NPDC060022]|uniref:hypothetical protein n=1 Tax=Streptomyces sp. NPDC060022 TaxID=3347039 RepID=UPI003693C87A
MASGNYSADIEQILRGSARLREAVRLGERMLPEFEEKIQQTWGWWGDEYGDDPYATQVGSQYRKEYEGVIDTLRAITNGFTGLVEAVADEAINVKRPQDDALDQINDESAKGGVKR